MELSGQFTDKPTSSQSSQELPNWLPCGLDDLWTSQLAKWFDVKFGVKNSSKCDFT